MATVKLTGAEFKRFFDDASIWGANDGTTYVEEDELEIDGSGVDNTDFDYTKLADAAVVTVSGGYLVKPPKGVPEDYVKAIKFWRKKQSMRQLLLDVPAGKLDAVILAVRALGAQVVV